MNDAPLTAAQIAANELQASKEDYVRRVLVGFDQFVGSVLDIQNDQTISSEAEIDAHKKVWYSFLAKGLNAGLDLIQASHGQKAQAGDLERAEAAIATDTAALKAETGNTPPEG
jgi:hypothetical protein